MRALTICQPYAHLICLPDSDPRHKRIENRTWHTKYRGPLLIHAGKSKKWLSNGNYGLQNPHMIFGAIIGICDLKYCYPKEPERWLDPAHLQESISASLFYPQATSSGHAIGPWCNVLMNVRKFRRLVFYCNGRQGLWKPSDEIVAAVQKELDENGMTDLDTKLTT